MSLTLFFMSFMMVCGNSLKVGIFSCQFLRRYANHMLIKKVNIGIEYGLGAKTANMLNTISKTDILNVAAVMS